MPSADFCVPIRSPHGSLSPNSGTERRSPGVSLTAFTAHLPDLQPWPLMDLDFAIRCPLVRPRMPLIRFLFVRSRFCSTLPPDPASRRRPCASLALRFHQAVQRTFTSKLSDMPGTQRSRSRDGRYAWGYEDRLRLKGICWVTRKGGPCDPFTQTDAGVA